MEVAWFSLTAFWNKKKKTWKWEISRRSDSCKMRFHLLWPVKAFPYQYLIVAAICAEMIVSTVGGCLPSIWWAVSGGLVMLSCTKQKETPSGWILLLHLDEKNCSLLAFRNSLGIPIIFNPPPSPPDFRNGCGETRKGLKNEIFLHLFFSVCLSVILCQFF